MRACTPQIRGEHGQLAQLLGDPTGLGDQHVQARLNRRAVANGPEVGQVANLRRRHAQAFGPRSSHTGRSWCSVPEAEGSPVPAVGPARQDGRRRRPREEFLGANAGRVGGVPGPPRAPGQRLTGGFAGLLSDCLVVLNPVGSLGRMQECFGEAAGGQGADGLAVGWWVQQWVVVGAGGREMLRVRPPGGRRDDGRSQVLPARPWPAARRRGR